MRPFLFSILLFSVLSSSIVSAEVYELKMASMVPRGSTWMVLIEQWAADLEAQSKNQLKIKLYPNGVSGDEPDVLRKIRYNQLQGAMFTGYGIGRFYSPARILEMPFLFQSLDEVDHVRKEFMPDIEQGFRDNNFELISWMEVGLIRIFSQSPVLSIDDLRNHRMWLWQNDPLAEAFFEASDLSPIPLSILDVYTSLSTGLVDTVYAPPLGAIALQWFTQTSHATNIPMANGIGSLVVSSKFFNGLPGDLQAMIKQAGQALSTKLIKQARIDNEESLKVLQDHGIKFSLNWEDLDLNRLQEIKDNASKQLSESNYIPKAIFDRTFTLLNDYRSANNLSIDKANLESIPLQFKTGGALTRP